MSTNSLSRSTYVPNDLEFKRLSNNVSSGKSKINVIIKIILGVIGATSLSPKV